MPPAGFVVAPAGATRTLSRTASAANDLGDALSADLDAEGEDDHMLFTDYADVARQLHLAAAPSPKVGPRGGQPKKGADENPKHSTVRLGGNILRVGAETLAVKKQVSAMELTQANDARRLLSGLQRVEADLASLRNSGGTAAPDSRVAFHDALIQQLSTDVRTLKERLDAVLDADLFDADGSALFAYSDEVQRLWTAVQAGFDLVDDQIKELVAEGTAEQVSELHALRAKVAESDAALLIVQKKQAETEASLLSVREKLAQTQTDLARHIIASPAVAASIVAAPITAAVIAPTASTVPAAARQAFTVGGKRKAATELVGTAAKRTANGKPNKALYHHWVRVEPVDANIGAVNLFKQLLGAVLPGQSIRPHYVERLSAEPRVLSVGFESAGDAKAFVDVWNGAYHTMPGELREIRATPAVVAGPSHFAHLAGN
ncbi:hypothetical protein C8R43DRAFT_993602 [Mycena crocata]|nr:hypothetical protein C8R43DRAFT_993602 [Mycena crocata]